MPSEQNKDIAGRAISGSFYSITASGVTIVLGFIRTFLLTRFILPADAGVVVQALFFLSLAALLRLPGMDSALIHREDAGDHVLPTYFTMRLGLLFFSLAVTVAFIPVISHFYPGMPLLGGVLLAFLGIEILKELNTVQEAILNRQLAFSRIAVADVVSAIAMTVVAPYLAWQGWGAWSLVMERLSGQVARMIVVWLAARPWRPRLGWDWAVARWFRDFSLKVWSDVSLIFVLDRFDDFWIGAALGQVPLGLYGRAYEFARYPRRVVANPILSVFFPAFARLQTDRLRLSKAFFRATSLMVRADFWFSLVFILAAPEFIQILGRQWQPMLVTFQLMILYTLLDPLVISASNLLLATGHPELNVRARLVQLAVFIPAVILLGGWRGIEGVALAADLMIATGMLFLFYHSRRLVDYSLRRLLFWPGVALVITAVIVLLLNPLWITWNPWLALPGKALLITAVYGGLLWLTEREQLRAGWQMVWGVLSPHARPARGSL